MAVSLRKTKQLLDIFRPEIKTGTLFYPDI